MLGRPRAKCSAAAQVAAVRLGDPIWELVLGLERVPKGAHGNGAANHLTPRPAPCFLLRPQEKCEKWERSHLCCRKLAEAGCALSVESLKNRGAQLGCQDFRDPKANEMLPQIGANDPPLFLRFQADSWTEDVLIVSGFWRQQRKTPKKRELSESSRGPAS